MTLPRFPAALALLGLCLAAAACGGASTPPNTTPIASAGADQAGVPTGAPLTLDASASGDADGDALTYAWSVTARPAGSTAALSSATAASPTFTPDVAGHYRFSLTVSDGRATSGPDAVDVEAFATWKPPARLDAAGQGTAHTADLATRGQHAIVAWHQFDPSQTFVHVWASVFDPATRAWGPAEPIEDVRMLDGRPWDAMDAKAAIDDAGNAVVVWRQAQPANYHLWANTWDAATGTWGTAAPIEEDADDTTTVSLAMSGGGRALCVWRQGVRIWASAYDPSTRTWSPAGPIQASFFGAVHPRVVVDPSGDGLAVWSEDHGSTYDLWSSRFDGASATWGPNQLLVEGVTGAAFYPTLGVDAAGRATAAWMHRDGAYDIRTSSRAAGPLGEWTVAQSVAPAGGDYGYPEVAVNAAGDAALVWWSNDPGTGRFHVWASSRPAGGSWGGGALIEADDDGFNLDYQPQVAIDQAGNALALWSWGSVGLRANRLDAATGAWGGAQTVGPVGSIPRPAFDGAGRPTVAWAAGGVLVSAWW